jgi:PAS domain S-box-containing protein
MPRLLASLRARLVLMVLLALLPVSVLTLYTDLMHRERAGQAARNKVQFLAGRASAEQSRLFEGARQLLTALAQIPALRDAPLAADPGARRAACERLLAELHSQYPNYNSLAVTSPDGEAVCSAPAFTAPVNFSDRDWFREAIRSGGFVVSHYLIGRITGQPTIVAAYPALDAAGQVQAVISATFDLAWFNDFAFAFQSNWPPGTALVIVDPAGTVLTRYPDPAVWLGRSVTDIPLYRLILAGGEGTTEEAGVDGVMRVYGFAEIARPDGQSIAHVTVGIPSAVVYGDAEHELVRDIGILGLVFVLAMAAAWLAGDLSLVRPVKALLAVTQRVAAGDFAARVNLPAAPGELGRLAVAFDSMGAALEEREQRLADTLEFNQKIIEAAPLGISTYRASGQCLSTNAAATDIIGGTREQILAQDFRHIESWQKSGLSDAAERALATGAAQEREVHLVSTFGRELWLDCRLVAFSAAGQSHLLLMFADVTRRRHAEKVLAYRLQVEELIADISTRFVSLVTTDLGSEMRRALQGIGEHIQVDRCYFGTYSADQTSVEHEYEWCAAGLVPQAERFIGMDVTPLRWSRQKYARREALVVSRLSDLPPEAGPEKALWQALGIRSLLTIPLFRDQVLFAYLGFSTEGEEREWSEQDIRLLRLLGEVFVNALLRKEAEAALKTYAAQLERSNRDLQDFAYIASHDLQEPLRKIQAFSDRLGAGYADRLDGTARDYLDRMQAAARRGQAMVNDLLTYSRVTTRGQPFVPVALDRVARDVVAEFDLHLEQTAGQITLGDLPTLEADPTQMHQLLQNLIANALKFRRPEEPPAVSVTARPSEGLPDHVEILVQDNGIGFDEKHAERIFLPFERLHGRAEYPGTGIGLAICRRIVERHGGTITARSTPGQGTTFIITLPLKEKGS